MTDNELRIGKFRLRPGYGGDHSIEIQIADGPREGEAGDFPVADIEALIGAYFQEHF